MFIQALHWFLGLGSTVGIPIIIIILGLIVGLKPAKAFISGLTLSAGFIGLNMVVNMMAADLQPAIKLMVSRYHMSLSIMDVGCGVGGPLAFSSSLGAIARAIAKNPKLLLCDEPTGALDYNTGKQILKLLQDTCRKEHMTVIIITHNSALAPMADRIIRFKSGRVTDITLNENPTPISEIEW